MSEESAFHRVLSIFFEVFYYLWAVAGLPIGIGFGGYVVYRTYPNRVVLSLAIVAFAGSIYLGYRLAEIIRRNSRHRGGMAGGMAPHATPELDTPPPGEENHRSKA